MHKSRLVIGFIFLALASTSTAARAQGQGYSAKSLAQYPPVMSPSDRHISSGSNARSFASAVGQTQPVQSYPVQSYPVQTYPVESYPSQCGSTRCGPVRGCKGRFCSMLCGACCQRVSPWHSPGNMSLHMPYQAEPENYYYFRPYNYMHYAKQQNEASWANPSLPYSNEVFQGVYADLGLEEIHPKLPDPRTN